MTKGDLVKIKSRNIIALILVMMMSSLLTGCATFENFKTGFIDKPQDMKATIQIGIYQPMTGTDSEAAEQEIKGIELAHEMYPTVNGKIVELVYADNGSDLDAAETAIKELIVKEPKAILGSYGSVYSLVAGEHIKDARIPAIAATNTNPLVTRNNAYYFRVCYVDSNQGDILAKYLLSQKKETTAGVLLPKGDDAALAMATAFTDRMKAETGNENAIVVYEEYKPGAKDFSKQLQIVKDSGVKSVILPGEMSDAANIIKQAKSMGLSTVFLGDTDWSSNDFYKQAGTAATKDNIAFVNFFDAKETINEESEKFLKAYREKYGADTVPQDGVALGYDAYLIALNAIDKADDDADANDVRKVLAGQTQFQGASGMITFSSTGDPIKTAYISTWENGKVVSIHTMDPQ